ncbi:hypothetical protein D0Y65_041419, partial [Glycine soja]
NSSKKESVRVLRSCISSLESGLGAIYKVQKDKGPLRSLRIFIIRPGAFDQLSELAIKNGTSRQTYEWPRMVRGKWLWSFVVSKKDVLTSISAT